ncbi:MAG: MIP/aquaporin family protein [Coriobacteriia bacterium]|nr:MIP/aquaporin family protein [Coriobacteriia bacterium]
MSKEINCDLDCAKHNTAGMKTVRSLLGEIIGTFMMCFFGIGAVANATLGVSGAFGGPFQVGMVWGITIAIAIYTTRNLSCAHFNPAVTFAMSITGRLPWKEFPIYIIGQFIGAIFAAALLWVLFGDSCMAAAAGVDWSSIWAERYPNGVGECSVLIGSLAEGIGVFCLVFVIFSMTEDANVGRPDNNLFPLFIGWMVTMIICVVGPITDAGLNPARDLGPRVIAAIMGMDNPMSGDAISCLLVYTVAPLIGGGLAGLFFTKVIEPHQHCGKCIKNL